MAKVRDYAAWAEQVIARVLIGEGLSAGLVGVKQGPLTLTFKIRVYAGQADPASKRLPLSLAASLRKALTLQGALAQALRVESVRVSEGRGGLLVEIPSPEPRTPSALELAEHTEGLRVCVGLDSHRRPVRVNLQSHGALFWIGPSRRGKTSSLKSSLFALARANGVQDLRYVILSRKRQDWAPFEGRAACMGLVSNPAEAAEVLSWAASELLQMRGEKGITRPAVVIVADDLLNLLSAEPGIAESLAEIASQGAGLGVHLLAGTQDAGSKASSGGQAVEANVTCRIVYKAATATGAARAAGSGGAGLEDLSSAKGDALLFSNGSSVRIATGLPDDSQIEALPAGAGLVAPWRFATDEEPEQPGSAGGNQGNQAWAPSADGDVSGNVRARAGGAGQAVESVEAVALVEGCEVSAALARRAAELLPVARRALEGAEVAVVVELGEAGLSKNKLSFAAYGHKDGKTAAWVKEALERGAEGLSEQGQGESSQQAAQRGAQSLSKRDSAGLPAQIDLNTPEGADLWQQVQRAGLVRLPDVASLLQ